MHIKTPPDVPRNDRQCFLFLGLNSAFYSRTINMDSKTDEKVAIEHGDDHHDAQVAVQLAHDTSKKLSPWTKPMFRLYLVLACAYLCGCLVSSQLHTSRCFKGLTRFKNGYDGSLLGTDYFRTRRSGPVYLHGI
jgi:hypothetical protein